MAIFPECRFGVLLPGGVVVPGARLEGDLELVAPRPVPRAKRINFVFRSTAWASYRRDTPPFVFVERRPMFVAPLRVELPDEALPGGARRFAFSLDVPPWLPPGFAARASGVEHVIELRLDVDWARDPVAKVSPVVALPPGRGVRRPFSGRCEDGPDSAFALEVTLASSLLASGEPLAGQVALRGGSAAAFRSVDLSLASAVTSFFGPRGRERWATSTQRLPASRLSGGQPVPFVLAPAPGSLPSFRSGFFDHDVVLLVRVDARRGRGRIFEFPLQVLPPGSTIDAHPGGGAGPTGTIAGANEALGRRLRQAAAGAAQAGALREGAPPALLEGAFGPVALRFAYAPREAGPGVDVDFTYPDLELGIELGRREAFGGAPASPLLTRTLAGRYAVRCAPRNGRPAVDGATLAAFLKVALAGAEGADDVRLSDHHLGLHVRVSGDERAWLAEAARGARERAEALGDVIAGLPFPDYLASHRPAWQAAAAELGAFLVPTGPALRGLTLSAPGAAGRPRAIGAAIRTAWHGGLPLTHVDLDLHAMPVPGPAAAELEGAREAAGLREVRAAFASARVHAGGQGVTLEGPTWAADPRALVPALEAFLSWLLDARGERRAHSPYR